jgi:hypothetical protein
VAFDLPLAAVLLFAQLVQHFLEEVLLHEPVEFADISECDRSVTCFRPDGAYCFFVLALLVGTAGVQRVSHPIQHLVVEFQQQFGELCFERILTEIFVGRKPGCPGTFRRNRCSDNRRAFAS